MSLLLPQITMADGMIMPPPDYWVQETAQKAVIFYDGGVETMVVSITFQGDAEKFGWVIPTPAKPTIAKGSDELFTSLEELTRINYRLEDNMVYDVMPLSGTEQNSVTVIETKQIEYYEVTTLSATDKDALTTWLNDNGYSYPEAASFILNSYIENGWFFVAMKINTESLAWDSVSQQLKTGHAVPVAISFETENLVYPMKISSVTGSLENSIGNKYPSGKVDKGIRIGNNDKLTIPAENAIKSEAGTIETWFKPNWTAGEYKIANIATVRSNDDGALPFRLDLNPANSADNYSYTLTTHNDVTNETNLWTSADFELDLNNWQQVALSWEKGATPSFYLNGTYVPLTAVSQDLIDSSPYVNDTLYIGSGAYDSRSINATVDEYVIYDAVRSADAIKDDYNKVNLGEALVLNNDMVFLAHFNSSLLEEVSGNELVYVSSNISQIRPYYSNTASIVLYVFDKNKKELSNFTTEYAGWIKKSEIEQLAVNDQGNPWIKPAEGKYFLTKMSRSMAYSEMTEDLFLRDAENNTPVNAPGTEDDGNKLIFYIVISFGVILTFAILFLLNHQSKDKK